MTTPEEVLAYWLGPPSTSDAELREKMRRWYLGGAEEDARLARAFGTDAERALAGELDSWAETPRGRLALILLLDQVTRAVFRDTPKAFAGDRAALRLALEALDQGLERAFTFEERQFLLMPLLHAEALSALERLGPEMERHIEAAPEFARPTLAAGREQAAKYREVIARFGRFPHRNAALGRPSTPEEAAFLEEWAARAKPALVRELDPLRGSAPPDLPLPDPLVREIRTAYGQAGRHYHDNRHLDEVLGRFAEVSREAGWDRPREAFIALLFHDVVYQPGAKDNEALSAHRAERAIATYWAGQGIDGARVAALILLTARHGTLGPGDVDRDAALFLDCDMAILGASPEAFEAYDRDIATEHGAIPAEAFAAGRRRFLESLLARDTIFLSSWGRDRFEAAARRNIAGALGRLPAATS
jgi:uncharacterized protein (DUF924 family)/predicted metal-dependent HD superfamily phosphohydrolase